MVATWIGPDIEFQGLIKAGKTVEIEGTVSGEVQASGRVLVRPQGTLEGNLTIHELVVAGHVEGDVKVVHQLEVLEKGELYCELESPPERLILSEKARVGGKKSRTKNKESSQD